MTNKRKIYTNLCNRLDELNKKYNLCDIHNNNGIISCRDTRRASVKYTAPKLCCGINVLGASENCKYHGKNGCRIKSLSCKIWYCDTIVESFRYLNPDFHIELRDILQEIRDNNITCFPRTPMNINLNY